MSALVIDRNVRLNFKSGGGTPTFLVASSGRTTGSITWTQNSPSRTRVFAANGVVQDDVKTAEAEFYGTITVQLLVNGGDMSNNTGVELHHIVTALQKQDLSLIPGTSWTAPFSYPQGGGCDANVDMDIDITYCSGGTEVTKTLSFGAVTVTDSSTFSIGEAQTTYNVTFQMLEDVDLTAWA